MTSVKQRSKFYQRYFENLSPFCSYCERSRILVFKFAASRIIFLADNTTTVCYTNNRGGNRSRACNIIAKTIWQFALEGNNFLSSAHLPGKQNILADRESRVVNDRTEWILHLDIFILNLVLIALGLPPLPQLNKHEYPPWTYLAQGDVPQNTSLLGIMVYLFKIKIIFLKLFKILKPGYCWFTCLSGFYSYLWFSF